MTRFTNPTLIQRHQNDGLLRETVMSMSKESRNQFINSVNEAHKSLRALDNQSNKRKDLRKILKKLSHRLNASSDTNMSSNVYVALPPVITWSDPDLISG